MAACSDTIAVQVSLRSVLNKYRPDPAVREPFPVHLAAGSTVTDLLRHCGVPPHRAGMVLVDGSPSQRETVVMAGGLVEVFPPIAGG